MTGKSNQVIAHTHTHKNYFICLVVPIMSKNKQLFSLIKNCINMSMDNSYCYLFKNFVFTFIQ